MRLQTKVFAMRCGKDLPSASTNLFAALADPIDDEVARDLSTWAHKVKIGQSSQKKAKFHRVRSHHGNLDTIIDSDEKLNQLVKRNPQHIAALPTRRGSRRPKLSDPQMMIWDPMRFGAW